MKSDRANPSRPLKRRVSQGLARVLGGLGRRRAATPVRRILVLRFDHLGDCVLSLPAITLLRRRCPAARIEVAAKSATAEVFSHCPAVDAVRVFDAPWSLTPAQRAAAGACDWRSFLRSLRRARFDLGIDLQGDPRNVWLLAAAGIGRRIGPAGSGADGLLTDPVAAPADVHRTLAACELAVSSSESGVRNGLSPASLPTPNSELPTLFRVDAASAAWAAQALPAAAAGPAWLAIHPGAASPLKQWPLGRFLEVAAAARGGPRIVVLAGPGEEALLDQWRRAPGTEADVLVRPDGIGRLAAALARCRALVCNDSGPMHVAGAVGTPVVAVFGATSPRHYGPLDRTRNRVLQPACDRAGCWVPPGKPACSRRCIESIEPQEVIAAVEELLPVPSLALDSRLSTLNSPEAQLCTAAF